MSQWDRDLLPCPICEAPSEREISLTAIQPDDLWMGQVTNAGYVTSKSSYKRMLKEKNWVELGDRSDKEAMRKMAEQGVRNRKARETRERRVFLEDAFSNSGLIDSDGKVRPEATVKISDDRIME